MLDVFLSAQHYSTTNMATCDHLFGNCVILLILNLSIRIISASDILGCGGFVKSHVNLDFSKIEIGL